MSSNVNFDIVLSAVMCVDEFDGKMTTAFKESLVPDSLLVEILSSPEGIMWSAALGISLARFPFTDEGNIAAKEFCYPFAEALCIGPLIAAMDKLIYGETVSKAMMN